ncbi:hypothetical protein [Chloroflexus sp.]|uniref:hypothetical protein n=1 Tax=Chloroflexus sp. TaxID=1904827 RepID=UPI002ACD9444|nr:hypothetical protein [Chloroflexus sp.]
MRVFQFAYRSILFLIFGLMIIGCAAEQRTVTEPTASPTAANPIYPARPGYPAPNQAYPVPTAPPISDTASTGAYPAPDTSNLPEGPQFTINQPVRLSTGQITGTGPAGVPIRIVNITRGAIDIATVTIGADGTFSAPLRETFTGDRVAIMLGNVDGAGLDRNQFLRGPGYEDWPLIGVLFASAIVEE